MSAVGSQLASLSPLAPCHFGCFGLASKGAEGFSATPSLVISEYLEPDEGEPKHLSTIYRDLALFAEEAHDVNRDRHLKPLTNYFRIAITLLTAEIAAWIVNLAVQ
jgi:hypothetical protein